MNTILEQSIKQCILQLAELRGQEKSLCPSEVARIVSPDDWRELMPKVRDVAYALVNQGVVKITQKGKDVSRQSVKGAIRISLK